MRDVAADLQDYFTARPIPRALSALGEAGGAQLDGPELVGLLGCDRGCHERVARLCGQRGASPRELLERLGGDELQRLVWVVAIGAALAPPERAPFRDFWQHALRTRAIVELLIEHCCPSVDPGPILLPALFHDAGKLVYHACYPDDARRIVERCRERAVLWSEAERALELPPHGELGAALVEFLGLPAAVATACRHHEPTDLLRFTHDALSAPEELVLVGLANAIDRISDPSLDEATRSELSSAVELTLAPEHDRLARLGGDLVRALAAADRDLGRLVA